MEPDKFALLKAQMKAKLRPQIQGIVGSNHDEVRGNVAMLVASAVTSSPDHRDTPSEPLEEEHGHKKAAFFPDLDEAAKLILIRIGASEDILVVPNTFDLSGSNQAITIKDPGTATNYQAMAKTAAEQMDDVSGYRVAARIKENTILVKQGLLSMSDLDKCGQIWHEYGHVLYDKAESGRVFAHELRCVAEHFGDLMAWIDKNDRGLKYYARFVSEPGIDELTDVLEANLDEDDFAEFQRLRHNVVTKAPVTPKDRVSGAALPTDVEVEQGIEGYLEELRARIGEPEATIDLTAQTGDVIYFGRYKFSVSGVDREIKNDPDPRFRLKRLKDD